MQNLDEMDGVIREVSDSQVAVSLFQKDNEYAITLPREDFERAGIEVRSDTSFRFWVESSNGLEKVCLKPTEKRQLTPEELWKIDRDVKELLK
jgi:hypothetical protein